MSSEDRKGVAGGVPSIISPDLQIVGDLKSDGEIQIDGTVKGDIKGHTLTVGEQGKIDGSTVAETVRIFGTVNGRVEAKTVHLDASAKVTADITHETLTIETGAYFEGKVQPLKGASSTVGQLEEEWAVSRRRKPRVSKPRTQRLQECESHLYFLWDARRLYPQQRDRFKQIAAELRILVCETSTNKPLLLDLMDEYGFSYDVQPPGPGQGGPPLKPGPLPMVGWRDDPVHVQLSEQLSEAIASGDKSQMETVERQLAELARPVPFRQWVNRGLAVYIAPYDYSNRELVLAIAQQFGSSHEDESIEEPIVRLQKFVIGGETSDIAPMTVFAGLVISVGRLFITHLAEHHGFEPQYFGNQAV